MWGLKGVVVIVSAFLAAATGGESPHSDAFASPSKDAEFRWLARDMYKSLQEPSCQTKGLRAPAGFRRADLLKPEQGAVRAFEERIKGTPAQFHFEVAKSDADLELAKGEGCWAEYDDLQIANRHLKMTQDNVKHSLGRMEAIAPSLTELGPANVSVPSGAAFRALARNLVRTTRPRCQQTVRADNEAVLKPARAAVSRFRNRLAGSRYAANFDLAEADIAYEDSIVRVECDDPSRDSVAKVSREFLYSVNRQITAIGRRFTLH